MIKLVDDLGKTYKNILTLKNLFISRSVDKNTPESFCLVDIIDQKNKLKVVGKIRSKSQSMSNWKKNRLQKVDTKSTPSYSSGIGILGSKM